MPTYLLSEGFQYGNTALSYLISKEADQETSTGPVAIADGQSTFEIAVSIIVAELKSIFIVCDQDVNLKTNSSGAPDDEIDLLAGQPLLWYEGSYYASLITADVTSVFIDNSSGAVANLYIFALQDPTP